MQVRVHMKTCVLLVFRFCRSGDSFGYPEAKTSEEIKKTMVTPFAQLTFHGKVNVGRYRRTPWELKRTAYKHAAGGSDPVISSTPRCISTPRRSESWRRPATLSSHSPAPCRWCDFYSPRCHSCMLDGVAAYPSPCIPVAVVCRGLGKTQREGSSPASRRNGRHHGVIFA